MEAKELRAAVVAALVADREWQTAWGLAPEGVPQRAVRQVLRDLADLVADSPGDEEDDPRVYRLRRWAPYGVEAGDWQRRMDALLAEAASVAPGPSGPGGAPAEPSPSLAAAMSQPELLKLDAPCPGLPTTPRPPESTLCIPCEHGHCATCCPAKHRQVEAACDRHVAQAMREKAAAEDERDEWKRLAMAREAELLRLDEGGADVCDECEAEIREGLEATIAALTAERDAALAKLDAMTAEKAKAEAARDGYRAAHDEQRARAERAAAERDQAIRARAEAIKTPWLMPEWARYKAELQAALDGLTAERDQWKAQVADRAAERDDAIDRAERWEGEARLLRAKMPAARAAAAPLSPGRYARHRIGEATVEWGDGVSLHGRPAIRVHGTLTPAQVEELRSVLADAAASLPGAEPAAAGEVGHG